MRYLIAICLFFLAPFLQANEIAQQTINAKRFDVNDGFNQNIILSITSDKYQRAWVGTQNGINIIHNNQVLSVKHDAQNPDSLSANIINDFALADDGNIWVATTNGVDKLLVDSLQVVEKIHGYPTNASRDIRQIAMHGDNMFLISHYGIYKVKRDNGQIEQYLPFAKPFNNNPQIDVSRPIMQSFDAHHLLIGSNQGAYLINTDSMNFKQLNASAPWAILDIHQTDNAIWLATKKSGLRKLDKTTFIELKTAFSDSEFSAVSINKIAAFDNKLLLNTNTALLSYSDVTHKITEIELKAVNRESPENVVLYANHIYQNNTMLLGTKRGLFQISQDAFDLRSLPLHRPKGLSIESVIADQDNEDALWFISSTSLHHWQFRGRDVLKTAYSDPQLTNYFIRLFQTDEFIILSEFDNGIHLFDKQTKQLLALEDNTSDNITIYDLIATSKDHFLVATSFGLRTAAIVRNELNQPISLDVSEPLLNTNENSFFAIEKLKSNKSATADSTASDSENQQQIYLLAGRFSGLWLFSAEQTVTHDNAESNLQKISQFAEPSMITSIFVDNNEQAWIQTADHGIYNLEYEQSKPQLTDKDFSYQPFEHNRLLPNPTPVCIAQSNQHDYWIGTLDGLSRYNSQTKSLRSLTREHGISDDDFGQSSCGVTKNGYVFFGSENDINIISPAFAMEDDKKNSPHLVKISSGKQRFSGQEADIVIKESPIIRLNFISQPTHLFSQVSYFFRLVGQHSDWVQTAEPETVYTNLSAGNYTFEVYAKYANQAPSKTISKQIKITTLWYKTDAAKAFYVLLSLIFIGTLVYLKIRTSRLAYDLENQKNRSLQQYNKQLEQQVSVRTKELAQKTLDAEKANQDKTRFIASASHDIRHPLNAAKLMLEHYKSAESLVDERKLINDLDTNINSLSRLIESILDLSKLDANDFKPYISEQFADDWLQILDNELSLLANHQGVSFSYQVENAYLRTDFLLVERVIRNLAQNAIEITPKGRSVSLIGSVIDEQLFKIEIVDQGPGIPDDMMEKIFQPFITYQNKGTGLGLTIAQQISENLSLNMRVETGSAGTKFSLDIPISANLPSQEKTAAIQAKDVNIWALDDDPFSLSALTSLLDSWQIATRAVNSPDDLPALVNSEQAPDIFIVDFHLSELLDAKILVDTYQAFFAHTKIIVVSAEQNVREQVDVPFLLKPIHPAKLKKLIFSHLKRQ